MKKLIILTIILFATPVIGAELCYTIPNPKVAKIVQDWLYLYPNTECEVKDGVDPATIPEEAQDRCDWVTYPDYYQQKYTDNQWIKEDIYRKIKAQIVRSRQKQKRDARTPDTVGTDELSY